MTDQNKNAPHQVLIVSSHPLFGKGIQRLLENRQAGDVQVVRTVATVDEAIMALDVNKPDLVVVDYDDEAVNRDEFLARFVESEHQLRVVLLSLKEGGSNAIVYDRRNMQASEIDNWLKAWTETDVVKTKESEYLPIEKKEDKRNVMKNVPPIVHGILAAIIVVVLTALGLLVLRTNILLPQAASAQAGPIDQLFSYHFVVIAFLFALIVGVILYSVIAFRRKKDDMEDAVHMEGNSTLEIAWTIIPLGVVLGFAMIGSTTLAKTMQMDPKALEIKVTGRQWAWSFEYPDYQITSSDLVLPVNKQALLRLTSEDVIHSFWVPEFRVKQDAVPGSFHDLRITPTVQKEFLLMCAEICGKQHAYMISKVRVVSQEEFDQWAKSQQVPTDPVARGEYWFKQQGCASCHSTDGSKIVGPTFKGLFGREETLIDGTKVTVDEAYIKESILNPDAKIVAGFESSPGSKTSVMPKNFGEKLSDEQINDIIEWIKTLK
jgi:cytochrome c oxidase subunit 2